MCTLPSLSHCTNPRSLLCPAPRRAHRRRPAPCAVYDLKAYKASVTPECTTGKSGGTSSYSMKFSPKTPCKPCDPKYCKKSGSTCTCTLPSGYSVTKDVTVYTKPQECAPLAVATNWEPNSVVTQSPNNLPYPDLKCAGNALRAPKSAAERAQLSQLLEQFFKEYAYHLYNQTSAFCDSGAVQRLVVSNVSGCLKSAGATYKSATRTYGPNASYADIRGVVTYTCAGGGRSQTMGMLCACLVVQPGFLVARCTGARPARPPAFSSTPAPSPPAGISKAAAGYRKECKPVIFVE